MIAKDFKTLGIILPRKVPESGSTKMLCPVCSHTRNKKDEPCLSVSFNKTETTSGAIFHPFKCHNCGFSGAVFPNGAPDGYDRMPFVRPTKTYKKPEQDIKKFTLTDEVVEFFKQRGIAKEVLVEAGIKTCTKTFNSAKGSELAIMFPFTKNGELINIQYRNLGDSKSKEFRMIPDCQVIYYGFDQVTMDGYLATDTLYVTEGLIDALTLRACGYPFVWSVPNGSPFEEEGKKPVENPALEFHNDPDAQHVISKVRRVVFIGDDDHPGRRLVKALATRCGIQKCWRASYPDGCKDINEVLVKFGKQGVINVLESVERFPVDGVVRISQLKGDMRTLYTQGMDTGLSTGFSNLDPFFRVGLGRLIIITGVPESGKSRFLANILNNMAKQHGIKVSMFAPENRPFVNWTTKVVQIHTGKRWGKPGDRDRITQAEADAALDFIDSYLTYNNTNERTLESITKIWEQQLIAEGTRYGVIDPFNYIIRPPNVDEGSFALRSLTYLSGWAVDNGFTIFVVVHPTKLHLDKNKEFPIVGAYNIFGSSHWFNCSDFILSIWRSRRQNLPVQLHVLKAKQEELGMSNKHVLFKYDVDLGLYTPHEGKDEDILPGQPVREKDDLEPDFDPFEEDDSKPVRNNRRKRGASI